MDSDKHIRFVTKAYRMGLVDDFSLWEAMSNYRSPVSYSHAGEIYRQLGFEPFVGYPLSKRGSK